MRRKIGIIAASLLIFISQGWSKGCIKAKCHAEINVKTYVHPPVDEEDCLACHQLKRKHQHPNTKGKDFVLTYSDQLDLCGQCHKINQKDPNLHPPVAEGQCTTCHNPHASDNPNLFVALDANQICNKCHSLNLNKQNYVHGPAAVGACTTCHLGHGDITKALLPTEEVNQLCFSCHTAKQEMLENVENVHEPVDDSCTNCHNPHGAQEKFQLEEGVPDLCFGCHDELQTQIEEAKSKHAALEKDRKCLNCHDAHGSNYDYNLQMEPFDLCMQCHAQPLEIGGMRIPSMKRFLATNTQWHGPIREKNCSGCHNPHGTENIRLLRKYFAPKFYASFDLHNYELCFSCHPKTLVLEEKTTRLTNFRDGDRNLHYLHVNQEKGRTCRACHQPHASQRAFHIREAVPFGNWALPINYKPLKNGGQCSPGCHKPKQYQRK